MGVGVFLWARYPYTVLARERGWRVGSGGWGVVDLERDSFEGTFSLRGGRAEFGFRVYGPGFKV